MAASIFDQVKDLDSTVVVNMNEVRLTILQEEGILSLATAGLNGCSAVAIASSSAAILAHIAPRPIPDTDPNDCHAGDRNVKSKMAEFRALFCRYRDHFIPETNPWVISAFYETNIALPDQKSIIEMSLEELGLPFANAAYFALNAREDRSTGHGTVVIDAREGFPIVYVEDERVNQLN